MTALAIAPVAPTAVAGPTVLATRPTVEANTDDLTFFVGGFNESGRSLKASGFELFVDGKRSARR